jgi:hypothetical protein
MDNQQLCETSLKLILSQQLCHEEPHNNLFIHIWSLNTFDHVIVNILHY